MDCPICLEKVNTPYTTECSHDFYLECITLWINIFLKLIINTRCVKKVIDCERTGELSKVL